MSKETNTQGSALTLFYRSSIQKCKVGVAYALKNMEEGSYCHKGQKCSWLLRGRASQGHSA